MRAHMTATILPRCNRLLGMPRVDSPLHFLVAPLGLKQVSIRHLPEQHLSKPEHAPLLRFLSIDNKEVLLAQVAVEITLFKRLLGNIEIAERWERDRPPGHAISLQAYRFHLDAGFLELRDLVAHIDAQ